MAQLKQDVQERLAAGLAAGLSDATEASTAAQGPGDDDVDVDSAPESAPAALRLHSLSDLGQRRFHVLREYGGEKDADTTLAVAGIRDQAVLLAWDGVAVDGTPIQPGEQHRPTRLQVQCYRAGSEAEPPFFVQMPVSATLKELRATLASRLSIEPRYLLLHRLDQTGSADDVPQHLGEGKAGQTLQALGLDSGFSNGSFIPLGAEMAGTGEEPTAVAVFQQRQRTLALEVEDRCSELIANAGQGGMDGEQQQQQPPQPRRETLSLDRTMSLSAVKKEAMAIFGISCPPEDTHLRVLDDSTRPSGLGWLLLDEKAKVGAAGIKENATVTLEKGRAPNTKDRLVLRCRLGTTPDADAATATAALHAHWELLVDRAATLKEVVTQMKSAVGVSEGEYHACRTNW